MATLPNLTKLQVPIGRVRLPQLIPALAGHEPLSELMLHDDDGGCEDSWADTLAFLRADRVERLRLAASC